MQNGFNPKPIDLNIFGSDSLNFGGPSNDITGGIFNPESLNFGGGQAATQNNGFLDFLGGDSGVNALGVGTDLLTGLLSFGLGKDQLSLGKKQLATSTAFDNRNLSNSANLTNLRLDKRQGLLNDLASRDGSVARDLSQFKVDGSAITI